MALQLPTHATIAGEEVVIVSAADYERLVAGSGQASSGQGAPSASRPTAAELIHDLRLRPRISPPNKLLADEEVAAFLIDHIGTMSKADLVEASRQRFGADRGPSAGQIERFAKAVHAQLEGAFGLPL